MLFQQRRVDKSGANKNCRPHSLSLSPEVPTPTYSTESKSRNQEIVVNGNLPFPGICLWLHCLPMSPIHILQLWAVEGEDRELCGDSWHLMTLISEPEEFCLAMTSAWYLFLPLCNPYYQTYIKLETATGTLSLGLILCQALTFSIEHITSLWPCMLLCTSIVASWSKGSPECTPSQCPCRKDPKGSKRYHLWTLCCSRF